MYALVKSPGDVDDRQQASTSTASTLPYAEPSTSWAHSAARDTVVDSDDDDDDENEDDDDGDGDDNKQWNTALDDEDNSLDECDSDTINDILSHYMYRRNIKSSEVSDSNHTTKSLVEYVNFNYIVNNFRTIGLHEEFDISHINDAQKEFQSFEKWFSDEKFITGKKYIKDLRLPLFCHLFLSIYSKDKDHHDQLLKFLNTFKYIFENSRGTVILQELNTLFNINKLSPRLLVFRKNKYVFSVSQEFLNILYAFFHQHFILKAIFQEWFDINYITDEDPTKVFKEYCSKNISKLNNQTEPNTHIKNNADPSPAFNDNLIKEKLENMDFSQSCTDSESYLLDDQYLSTNTECISDPSQQKPSSSKNQSTENDIIVECGNYQTVLSDDINDPELETYNSIKTNKKSNDHLPQSPSKRLKKNEEHTIEQKEVDGRIILKFTQKSNKLSDISEKGKIPKKQQKVTTNRKKSTDHYRSSLSEISYEGSSEESSSQDSSVDEELEMRNYFKKQRKPMKNLSYKTSRLLKLASKTKIKAKSIDEDSYLCTTRKIFLKNCSKLTCSLITSDHKYIAAGSLDSLIYLWERSCIPTELDVNNMELESSIGQSSNSIPFEQKKNCIEIFDKSTSTILRGHGGPIFDIAEISSAKILLSASNDKTFRVWDFKSKHCIEVYDAHEYKIWCIATCSNSLQIATGSCEGLSCLWFLNYKRPLRIFSGHLDDVLVVKFHPNEILIATGSSDKTVRIFEITTAKCQRLLLGHKDYVTCLEFHNVKPNVLASASGAGEIIVWDLPSGQSLWKLNVGNVRFSCLIWLNDDMLLGSLTNGTVLKCDVNKDYSSKKVAGYATTFERLISLQIIDTFAYMIGIQGKTCVSKSSSMKHQNKKPQQTKNDARQSQQQKEPPQLQQQQQPIVENSGNSIESSSSGVGRPAADQYEISPASKRRKKVIPSPTATMNNIQVIQKPYIQPKATPPQKAVLKTVQKNIQIASLSPSQIINVQSDNNSTGQIPRTSQQTAEPTAAANVVSQRQILNNRTKTNVNSARQSRAKTRRDAAKTADGHVVLHDVAIQPQQLGRFRNSIHIVGQNNQQQSSTSTQSASPLAAKLNQKNSVGVLQQQQLRSQPNHRIGGNIRIAGINVLQQQSLFQQLNPNVTMTANKGNGQQQSNIRLTSVNVKKSVGNLNAHQVLSSKPGPSSSTAAAGGPSVVRVKQPKLTMGKQKLEKLLPENYEQMRQSIMASLFKTNPEMFVGGQPVIGEITRNPSTAQPNNDAAKTAQDPETRTQN